MRSMKFEKVQIHFLSEFSVPRRPEILLPWQRDVKTSHLHYKKKERKYLQTCLSKPSLLPTTSRISITNKGPPHQTNF